MVYYKLIFRRDAEISKAVSASLPSAGLALLRRSLSLFRNLGPRRLDFSSFGGSGFASTLSSSLSISQPLWFSSLGAIGSLPSALSSLKVIPQHTCEAIHRTGTALELECSHTSKQKIKAMDITWIYFALLQNGFCKCFRLLGCFLYGEASAISISASLHLCL